MADHPYTLTKLSNGLNLVIERMPRVRSAAAGFLVRAGARDETPELAGVSHFLEHMMFKGTTQRTWRDITVDFDRMGSTYNAYTSNERTVYYGWVPAARIEEQIELLADMIRSQLPPDEFDTEKKVVLEEIAMAKDQLEHVAVDLMQERVFAGHSLAWPVLGYEHTVGPLERNQMWAYFQQRYAPDNLTLLVAGHVEPDRIIEAAERYCGSWAPAGALPERRAPAIQTGQAVQVLDRFQQQILILTYPAVAGSAPEAETAGAIATILGGENSRYFWNIMQAGISPRAGVFHFDFSDVGLMVLWGTCPPDHADQLLDAMRSEAKRLTDEKVATHEVERVKNRRRTALAIEAEAPYHRLGQLIEDMEMRGEPRTVDQMLAEVDAISADSISAYLQHWPIHGEGHLTSVGPRQWPA